MDYYFSFQIGHLPLINLSVFIGSKFQRKTVLGIWVHGVSLGILLTHHYPPNPGVVDSEFITDQIIPEVFDRQFATSRNIIDGNRCWWDTNARIKPGNPTLLADEGPVVDTFQVGTWRHEMNLLMNIEELMDEGGEFDSIIPGVVAKLKVYNGGAQAPIPPSGDLWQLGDTTNFFDVTLKAKLRVLSYDMREVMNLEQGSGIDSDGQLVFSETLTLAAPGAVPFGDPPNTPTEEEFYITTLPIDYFEDVGYDSVFDVNQYDAYKVNASVSFLHK